MKQLYVLTHLLNIDVRMGTIIMFVCTGIVALLIWLIIRKPEHRKPHIYHRPTETMTADQIGLHNTIVIIDNSGPMPIAQHLSDYQESLSTGTYKKTFFVAGVDYMKLEKDKTYTVYVHTVIDGNYTRKLKPCNAMITKDFVFG